jgi:hypothetical protein
MSGHHHACGSHGEQIAPPRLGRPPCLRRAGHPFDRGVCLERRPPGQCRTRPLESSLAHNLFTPLVQVTRGRLDCHGIEMRVMAEESEDQIVFVPRMKSLRS